MATAVHVATTAVVTDDVVTHAATGGSAAAQQELPLPLAPSSFPRRVVPLEFVWRAVELFFWLGLWLRLDGQEGVLSIQPKNGLLSS